MSAGHLSGTGPGGDGFAARLPLAALYRAGRPGPRPRFWAVFRKVGSWHGGRASLLAPLLGADGRWLAGHVWVQRVWGHVRPGDVLEFFGTVVCYPRRDGTVGYTVEGVNGLIVCRRAGEGVG